MSSPIVLLSGCIEQPDIVSTNGTFVAGIFLLIIDKFVNFNAEVAVFHRTEHFRLDLQFCPERRSAEAVN
jgi:hypothetical protein